MSKEAEFQRIIETIHKAGASDLYLAVGHTPEEIAELARQKGYLVEIFTGLGNIDQQDALQKARVEQFGQKGQPQFIVIDGRGAELPWAGGFIAGVRDEDFKRLGSPVSFCLCVDQGRERDAKLTSDLINKFGHTLR